MQIYRKILSAKCSRTPRGERSNVIASGEVEALCHFWPPAMDMCISLVRIKRTLGPFRTLRMRRVALHCPRTN